MRIAWECALAMSAVALCSAGPAGAGTNQFTLIGPEGGHIQQVQFHPTLPDVAYAITNGGYYRTTDAGLHWQLVGANLDLQFAPVDLAVDPSDPSRVLVAAPGRAPLVSTDSGATLAQGGNFPLNPVDLRHVEFSADGLVVYGAADGRIVRSTDGGQTWSARTTVTTNPSSPLQFLRVDPLNRHVVYVYDLNEGGFRSTDGGGSWQPFALPADTADLAITNITPQSIWAATRTGGVQRSTGGGPFLQVFQSNPGGAVALALHPTNHSVVFASLAAGVFRTDGSTWTNVTDGTRMGLINSIAVNPHAPTNLMLGGTYGLFAGTPAAMGTGGDWDPRQQGILAANAGAMSAAGGRVYIQTFDAGVHFLAEGVTGMTPVDNEELQQLQSFPSDAATFGLLAQARSADRLFVGMSDGYARSDDGGDSWSLGTVGGGTVMHFADSPGDPDLILAATSNAVRRSPDGGATWLPVTAGLPSQPQVHALMFSSVSPNIVYAGTDAHGVYKSIDGGASWSAANAGFETKGIRALAIDATDAQIVYAAAHPDLLKTTDGGASWSLLDAPTSSTGALAVASDPVVPGIVYVAGFNNFWRSVDAGATWQALRAADATPDLTVTAAVFADPRRAGTLLASTIRNGVAEITVAPNLGLESPTPPASPVGIGAQATYRYRLRNNGPFHATGARVVVTLPAGATGISATTSAGACVVQMLTVTCTTPVLETGTSADINVSAAHPASGAVEVLASASGDQSDPQLQNNDVRYAVVVQQLADMVATVTGPLAATTSSAVTYTYTITNSGPNEASAVTAVVTLPNGMTSASATTTRGTCAISGLVVNCTLGNVPDGASTTIAVTASTPASGGNLQVVGRTESTTADSGLTNNQASISTTVSAPPPSGGGGGGGGGTTSLLWVLALAVLQIVRSYASPNRFRISGVGPSNAAIGTLPTYFRSRKPTGVV